MGLDLAGHEVNFPRLDPFIRVFETAKQSGLHIPVHAAEAGPAANARDAIEQLGAERIGHGIRIRENVAVLDMINRLQIPLEICPTSNMQTGAIPKLGQHPVFAFHQLGIPVTINTDDPSISNTTLTDEFQVTVGGAGVPFKALCEMVLNAARAAFLPPAEKERLVNWFTKALGKYTSGAVAE